MYLVRGFVVANIYGEWLFPAPPTASLSIPSPRPAPHLILGCPIDRGTGLLQVDVLSEDTCYSPHGHLRPEPRRHHTMEREGGRVVKACGGFDRNEKWQKKNTNYTRYVQNIEKTAIGLTPA